MEEGDKGCPMIRMGVRGWMFLLVPAYPGCPGQKAVKRLCVCVCVYFPFSNFISFLIDGFLMKFGAFVVMKQGEPIRFSECTYFGYCGYVSLAVSPLFRNWSAFCRCGGQKLSVLFFETPCNWRDVVHVWNRRLKSLELMSMGNWPLTCTMILILHLVCFHCCLCCFCYASTRPVDGARGSMFCACVHRCQTETFLTGLLSIF